MRAPSFAAARVALALALALALARPTAAAPRRTPVVEAVEKAAPAVVMIQAAAPKQRSPFRGAPEEPDLGQEFFGPQRRPAVNLGSGVIVDPRGYVVTNEHVIAGAAQVRVQLADHREFTARVVGADARFDLAVLKIDTKAPLPVVVVGTARDLMPGETVIAIGNPFGLSHTVSTGVVSALHRVVPITRTRSCEDCIQTDAAINPGNSGGALLNINGELIGINAAIRANANNIGFAIPIDRAWSIVDDLLRFGSVRYGWIGIYPQDIRQTGVAVGAVDAGSPAAKAGIRAGDVMLALGDAPLRRAQEYLDRTAQLLSGEEIAVRLARGVIKVKAGWLSPQQAVARLLARLGLEVAAVAGDRESGPTLQVTKVTRGGLAAEAGMAPGDLLRAINHRSLRTVADFHNVLAGLRPGADAVFAVQRGPFVWYVSLAI
jgi:serine protease Do